ncbi:MAG: pyridoxine 5'-phosphate synthase [Proteobacteria bacterium]|nr:pyridoxine 5'-phosphate synthase [Pseudomonadota bacterium]
MRRLCVAFDAWVVLREEARAAEVDLGAAAALTELAGAASVRIGIGEELRPVSEADVQQLRRTARRFELRMTPAQGTLKVALEVRPDAVVLTRESSEGTTLARPLDLRERSAALTATLRALEEARLPVSARVAPELEAVKAAHGLGLPAVEFYTGAIVDLPGSERQRELERLADAVRLAAKLGLRISVGGGLGFSTVPEVLELAPAVEQVTAGRSLVARSLLLGLDRTVRDFRSLLS